MSGEHDGLRGAVQRRPSFWQTVRAVGWAFFGVRRRAGLAEDVGKLNPLHLVIVGLACGALFVVALVLLVRWVIHSGVAA